MAKRSGKSSKRGYQRQSERSSSKKSKRRSRGPRRSAQMLFSQRNYVLLGLGVLMITVGYIIMRLENEVEGFISLYVAPVILVAGYLEIIYAILWRPRATEEAGAE